MAAKRSGSEWLMQTYQIDQHSSGIQTKSQMYMYVCIYVCMYVGICICTTVESQLQLAKGVMHLDRSCAIRQRAVIGQRRENVGWSWQDFTGVIHRISFWTGMAFFP